MKATTSIYCLETPWKDNTATWLKPWKTEGGDFDEKASIFTVKNTLRPAKNWRSFDVTKPINDMHIKEIKNNGFIFVPSKVTENVIDKDVFSTCDHYYSSEHSDQNKRPKLVITYENSTPVQLPNKEFHHATFFSMYQHKNKLTLVFQKKGILNFTIYSIQGKRVFQKVISAAQGQNLSISLKGNPSGMYILDTKGLSIYSNRQIHEIQKIYLRNYKH